MSENLSKEENMLLNVKATFEDYKKRTDLELEKLNSKIIENMTLLSFYKFESLLRSNKLSKECMDVYQRNNVDNNRFSVIMELRNQYETFKNNETVPIEIKFLIEELMRNG